jgi:hypothetical protein
MLPTPLPSAEAPAARDVDDAAPLVTRAAEARAGPFGGNLGWKPGCRASASLSSERLWSGYVMLPLALVSSIKEAEPHRDLVKQLLY